MDTHAHTHTHIHIYIYIKYAARTFALHACTKIYLYAKVQILQADRRAKSSLPAGRGAGCAMSGDFNQLFTELRSELGDDNFRNFLAALSGKSQLPGGEPVASPYSPGLPLHLRVTLLTQTREEGRECTAKAGSIVNMSRDMTAIFIARDVRTVLTLRLLAPRLLLAGCIECFTAYFPSHWDRGRVALRKEKEVPYHPEKSLHKQLFDPEGWRRWIDPGLLACLSRLGFELMECQLKIGRGLQAFVFLIPAPHEMRLAQGDFNPWNSYTVCAVLLL